MTDKSAREVIAGAVLSVCSDGNSDNNRVASDILAALDAGGFAVVPKEPTEEMMEAAAKTLLVDPSRLSPGGVDELRRALSAAIRAAKSREDQ